MGGALGLHLADGPDAARFKSLTLNDIGPTLDREVATGIQAAVSASIKVATVSDLIAAYEAIFGAFGMKPSDGRTWQDMALEGARRTDDGSWTLHFDTRVAEQFSHAPTDFNQTESFKRLSVPIQVFRGTESTVLTRSGLNEMRGLQPDLQITEVQGVGHAPLLDRAQDLEVILDFLRVAERTSQNGVKT